MRSPHTEPGTLYLLPVWLGEAGGTEQLPPENLAAAARIGLFFCEQERTARRMLRDRGLLDERKVGMPAVLWYRVNWARLHEMLEAQAR
ncbi:MAG: hypothetical protein ACK4L7_09320, partial [Flavobacteriales bacterium]